MKELNSAFDILKDASRRASRARDTQRQWQEAADRAEGEARRSEERQRHAREQQDKARKERERAERAAEEAKRAADAAAEMERLEREHLQAQERIDRLKREYWQRDLRTMGVTTVFATALLVAVIALSWPGASLPDSALGNHAQSGASGSEVVVEMEKEIQNILKLQAAIREKEKLERLLQAGRFEDRKMAEAAAKAAELEKSGSGKSKPEDRAGQSAKAEAIKRAEADAATLGAAAAVATEQANEALKAAELATERAEQARAKATEAKKALADMLVQDKAQDVSDAATMSAAIKSQRSSGASAIDARSAETEAAKMAVDAEARANAAAIKRAQELLLSSPAHLQAN